MPPARDEIIEPDRMPGLPHPRERGVLFGHASAEATFADALRSGRLHHAWLIGGPQGIGKATLAYRVARALLASEGRGGPAGLAVDLGGPVARQVAALSHPNLAVLRRTPGIDGKAPSTTIPVDAVRRATALFGSTAANGGYRICIVDSAEDLTPASANALLKVVEEPPPRSLFLIISHHPQRVLPTVRSRCRRLALAPLGEGDLRGAIASLGAPWSEAAPSALDQAVALAAGSARRAVEMLDPDRAALVTEVSSLLAGLPKLELKRVLDLAEKLARREAEDALELTLDTVLAWASARIREQASAGAARLAPLAEVCEKIAQAARDAATFNLDKRPLVVTLFDDLAEAVRRSAAAA